MATKTKLRADREQALCDQFNRQHQVGTPVQYWPGPGPRGGKPTATSTRSQAQVLSGHTAVVWLHRISGCVALAHVEPIAADDRDIEQRSRNYMALEMAVRMTGEEQIVCRPLLANVPEAPAGAVETACQYCGRPCWKLPIEPDPLPAKVAAGCTSCALIRGANKMGATP